MDEFYANQVDWGIVLAKSNVNILRITDKYIYYEYQFRMANGLTKWTKTVIERAPNDSLEHCVEQILEVVRAIRIGAEAPRKKRQFTF